MSGWTLAELVETLVARGDAPAVIAVQGDWIATLNARDLGEQARALARGLVVRGLTPGEPVAICASNSAAWIVSGLAVGLAGGVLAGVDAEWSPAEIDAVLADFGGRFVFAGAEHLVRLRDDPRAADLTLVALDVGATDRTTSWREVRGDEDVALPQPRPEDAATLFYTSGTTGRPKAFTLSWCNIAANIEALVALRIVGGGDRGLLPLPLHHVYPWCVGVLTPLSAGVCIVLPEAPSGPKILQALRLADATFVVGVPRLYEAIVVGVRTRLTDRGVLIGGLSRGLWSLAERSRRRLRWNIGRWLMAPVRRRIAPRLRTLISGGAHLDPAVAHALEGLGFEVLSGYGLAETASIFTANVPGRKCLDSAGMPLLEDGAVRIAPSGPHGVGEVELKGPSVFDGYRGDPEANARAFTADGWFRTGDLGFVDDRGFLHITGRAKEMIVLSGGKNLYPEEIEAVLSGHPTIAEVAVLERFGQIVALVRPDLDRLAAIGATRVEDALRVALTERAQALPGYSRPAGFAVVRSPLPRTRLGKLRRFQLPELYDRVRAGHTAAAEARSADDRTFLERPRVADVWALLSERYRDKPLALNASPALDLGIDSFEWMDLSVALEQRFGIVLDEDVLGRIETVRDLLVAAESARGASLCAATDEATSPERWLAPAGPVLALLGILVYGVVRLLMRGFFRLRAEGLHLLPAGGPLVLAANHASDLDPLALAAALPLSRLRRTFWAADAVRLFRHPVSRLLCRVAHVFPVDERKPAAAIRLAELVLRRAGTQVWFPEAWRSPDGRLQPFLPGIGKLIAETGAPVTPVFLAGTYDALPRTRRWPRPVRIRVVFGPAIGGDVLAAQGDGATAAERIADGLRREVAALGRSIGGEP
jgi:long-chain acyl-CoA synthetase